MSDEFIREDADLFNIPREIVFLVILIMVVPHTFEINVVNAMDSSYVRCSFFAAFWIVSLSAGSNIAGPFTSVSIDFLGIQVLVYSLLFLPFLLILLYSRIRTMKGSMSKRTTLRTTGITLIVHLVILFGFFWYTLDGWAFAQLYPLPIIHLLIIPKWLFKQSSS